MKRYLIFWSLLILCCLVLSSQSDPKDMENRLAGAVGKERIRLLSELATIYRNKEPKKTLAYGKEALALLRTFPQRRSEMILLNDMSTASVWLGDYAASERYALKSRAIARETGDKTAEADAIYNIGWTRWKQGRYAEAKEYYASLHKLCAQIEYPEGLAKSFRLMGMISWRLGDFANALENIFNATKIYETLSDREGIAELNTNSGIIYVEAGEFREGLEYFSQAYRHYKTMDEKTGMSRTLNNIGFTYCKMGKPEEGLKYLIKSLSISRELGAKDLIATVTSSIGEAYSQMEDYGQALVYFAESLKIEQELKDSMGVAYDLIQIGEAEKKLGQLRQARQSLERALKIARKIDIKNEIKTASKELSEIYETLGDHGKAVRYYREYKEIDEKIFNEMRRKKMVEIQALYETDKKTKELAMLKKDRQLQQLELEHQGNMRNFFIITGLLVLLSAFAIYTGYRLKTRTAGALSQEIDRHKQTAAQLRESEEKFRTLAEKSVVGVRIIRDHVIKYANPAFLELFGFTPGEIMGQDPLKLVLEEDRPAVIEKLKLNPPVTRSDVEDGSMGSRGFEFRGLTREGNLLYLECYSVQILYQGEPAVLETIIDMTDRKKAEAELLKMRKLESVGTLAGTIAHDFNNLLSIITGNAEKLKKEVQYTPGLHKMVENIEKTSRKAADLAQKLIMFSEGGEAAARSVSLASILKTTMDTYPQMQKIIRRLAIPTDLRPICGDEQELSQVIINLLWNADEAKIDGKDVAVTIAAQNTSFSRVNNYSLKAGDYVKVSVTDNGKGIPENQLEKVFNPYFSTKDTMTQKGMGLGLAICYSIVKKHNGHISVKSGVEKGTTVELVLPAYLS